MPLHRRSAASTSMVSTVPLLTLAVLLLLMSPASAFVRGDANLDGSVDLGDAIAILGALFIPGTPALECQDAGDVNDDGSLTVADPVYLLSYLFVAGSSAPPAPFPDDGPDPTPDPLGDCDPPGGILPFETIAQGAMSGAPEQTAIIRESDAWIAFWAQHTSTVFPPPPRPPVDFDTDMVVVMVRHANTSGYSVNIDELMAAPPLAIEIHYTLGAPLSGCPVLMVLTQPFHFVSCPQTAGDPVEFQTLVDTCP